MHRQPPIRASRLVVGVPTYRRPGPLGTLLTTLVPQLDEVAPLLENPARVYVVVVDNDPEGSARPVVDQHQDPRFRYVLERRPGVAAARNAVLDACDRLGADLLLFIDDDETPEPGWATTMVTAGMSWGVAGVAGPVITRTEEPMDPWVQAGGFYDREHRKGLGAGEPVRQAATNNLLLDLVVVRELGLRFDDRFGFTGGEDSVFTGALVDSGHRLAWCPTAPVLDHLPADRATRDFVLRRTFTLANGSVRNGVLLARSSAARLGVRVRALGTGLARLGLGVGRRAWGQTCGSIRHQARGARMAARGRGELAALIGRTPQPYSYGRALVPQGVDP